jgi:hypothetical protein
LHLVFFGQHARAGGQNAVAQFQHGLVADEPGELGAQEGVINGGEVLFEVALQHVAPAAGELLAAVERAVRAFAEAVGVSICDEAPFPDRLGDVGERMMHHAVSKRRGGDTCTCAARKRGASVKRRLGSWM